MDEKLIKGRIVAVVVAFLLTVVDGIVSNRADGVFVSGWPFMEQLVLRNLITFICMALFTILYLGLLLRYWGMKTVLQRISDIKQGIVELDTFLLRGLVSLASSNDIEKDMQRILRKLLHDAASIFEERIERAALLVPNSTKDSLRHSVDYQMPHVSIESMKFCVDHESSLLDVEKQIAEEAFITGEVVIADVSRINGIWVYKGNTNTKKLGEKDSFSTSIVAVPITSGNYDTPHIDFKACLGVLCFESLDKQVFDSKAGKLILYALAVRMNNALLTHEQYRRIQNR